MFISHSRSNSIAFYINGRARISQGSGANPPEEGEGAASTNDFPKFSKTAWNSNRPRVVASFDIIGNFNTWLVLHIRRNN